MVYGLKLFYDDILDKLDVKYIAGSTKGYTIPPGVYKTVDNNSMLNYLLPKEEKVNIEIDDNRLKSNLTTKKSIGITERSFSLFILGFIQSHSGEIGDIERFVQLIPGT